MGVVLRNAGAGALFALAYAALGCEAPYLSRDGTVVFPEHGARGAAVMTANGIEFHDRAWIPPRVVRRDAHEPWRAPIGFILPKDGRFTQTSRATVITTPGLAVVLRPSDTRVPAWGGEVMVRLDVMAPASADEARPPERIALVVDPAAPPQAMTSLVDAALDALGATDRIALVDVSGAPLLLPVTGRYRTLVAAAVAKRLAEGARARPNPAAAIAEASRILATAGTGVERVVFLSDANDAAWRAPELDRAVERAAADGVRVSFIAASDEAVDGERLGQLAMSGAGVAGTARALDERWEVVRIAVPPSGHTRFRDVVVSFAGAPAPSQVLEASSGEVRWRLDAGEVELGDVSAGEARAEILRVSVPAWVPGESFALHAEARFFDVARNEPRVVGVDLTSVYDDDIERIAESRHGDVIAFASALATLKRLDRAFVGEGIDRVGGLRALAELHARSMTLLAADTRDEAIREQADVLRALLGPPRPAASTR